jgi:ketosteroid isomerase-like protein
MKKLWSTIAAMLFILSVFSQTHDEALIRKLDDSLREAFLKKDTIALLNLYAPGFVVNSPFNRVSTLQDILTNIRQGKDNRDLFERNIEKITFIENIAVVMGREILRPSPPAPNAGKTVTRRFTNIWMKNKSGWQMVARQSTIISVE